MCKSQHLPTQAHSELRTVCVFAIPLSPDSQQKKWHLLQNRIMSTHIGRFANLFTDVTCKYGFNALRFSIVRMKTHSQMSNVSMIGLWMCSLNVFVFFYFLLVICSYCQLSVGSWHFSWSGQVSQSRSFLLITLIKCLWTSVCDNSVVAWRL